MTISHFTEGGTGVTNFDIEQKEIYESAVKEYGDDNIYIGPPFGRLKSHGNYLALHAPTDYKDLSKFWRIFDIKNKLAKETG
jgi:hypothetical protein